MKNTIKIEPADYYCLITGSFGTKEAEDACDFEIANTELVGSDDEDGGGSYDVVLKHKPTGKLYMGSYTDWDIDNTDYDEEEHSCPDRVDLECELHEVQAYQTTVTVYK